MKLLENLIKAKFLKSSKENLMNKNIKYNCFGDEECFCNDPETNKYNSITSKTKNKVYKMK